MAKVTGLLHFVRKDESQQITRRCERKRSNLVTCVQMAKVTGLLHFVRKDEESLLRFLGHKFQKTLQIIGDWGGIRQCLL